MWLTEKIEKKIFLIDSSLQRAEALSSSVLQNERLKSRDLDLSPGILPLPESTDLGFSLVGNGESWSWCGKIRFRGCFNREKHVDSTLDGLNSYYRDVIQQFYASCGRLDCPICYEKACGKLSKKIEWRLSHFSLKNRILKPIHVVASVPISSYSLDYSRLKSLAIKLLKLAGLFGGCIIFHPWRLRCSRCGGSMEYENGQKICGKCYFPLSRWVFSPHFHALGYGWMRKIKHVFEKHGWIIRNFGVRDSISGTALYQLSHAGFLKKKHTVTWFGSLAYNKMRCPRLPKLEYLCPLCNEKMVPAKLKDPNMKTKYLQFDDGQIFYVDMGVFEEDLYCSVDRGGGSLEDIEERLVKFLDCGGI